MEEKNWPELFARYLIVERGYSEKTKKVYCQLRKKLV